MDKTLGLLLAGGAGSRLGVLASLRAKPAVPFGGIYRIIDFALSNAANSEVNWLGVLTQYKPLALMEHIGDGKAWGFIGRSRGVKILPPRTGEKDSDWYKGTADAVRQNLDFIQQYNFCDTLLILSGDHIYNMDYSEMIEYHRSRGADVTIATMEVPLEDARHFGIANVDAENRIVAWEEKPKHPKSRLASMGIYAFSIDFLLRAFAEVDGVDFGQHIVPYACRSAATYAYPFHGYWRDVGTVKAYWRANLDMLNPAESGLMPENWKIYTNIDDELRFGDYPPTFVGQNAMIRNSIVSQGCVIEGEVVDSVLSPGVHIAEGARVQNSVLMHNCHLEMGSCVDRIVADKNVTIGEGSLIGVGESTAPNEQHPSLLEEGLNLIGKGANVPAGFEIGRHCIIKPFANFASFNGKKVSNGVTI